MEDLWYDIYNETWKASPFIKFTFSAVGYIPTAPLQIWLLLLKTFCSPHIKDWCIMMDVYTMIVYLPQNKHWKRKAWMHMEMLDDDGGI